MSPEKMEEEEGYTTGTVSLVTGATHRQLDSWIRKHLFYPSVRLGVGQGNEHRYSLEDIYRVHLALTLIRFGFKASQAFWVHQPSCWAQPHGKPEVVMTFGAISLHVDRSRVEKDVQERLRRYGWARRRGRPRGT